MEVDSGSEKDTIQPTLAREVSQASNGCELDRTAKTWLEQTKSVANLTTRKMVLTYWVQAMGFKDAEEGATLFKAKKLHPTTTGNKFVTFLENAGKAPSTIFRWRNVPGGFFRYLVPDMPKGLYNPKKVDLILLTEKEGLERDQIKSLFEKASPKLPGRNLRLNWNIEQYVTVLK
jgi:hypothetical protein